MTTKEISLHEERREQIEESINEETHSHTKVEEERTALQKLKDKYLPILIKGINHLEQQPHERKAIAVLGLGVLYFFLGVFSIHFNISMLMILGSIGFIIASKIKKAKKTGIINKLSPNFRTLLMKRSVFDILCDLWYFPIIPKYIKAIFGPFIFKKDPEVTIKNFDELHPKFKKLVLTKGIINIIPTALKNFILPDNLLDIDAEHINESSDDAQNEGGQGSTRDNSDTNSNNGIAQSNVPYIKERNLVHEAIEELNKDILHKQHHQKLASHLPGTTEVVICSQDVQNQIKKEKLLKYLAGNVQDKYYKANHYHFIKEHKEKNSSFSTDPRVFLLKFLSGSKNVSEKDRKSLKKALFFASIVLGTQLYFSKQSRQWLKYTVLFMVYLAAIGISSGSFVLLSKHNKASKKIQQDEKTLQEDI